MKENKHLSEYERGFFWLGGFAGGVLGLSLAFNFLLGDCNPWISFILGLLVGFLSTLLFESVRKPKVKFLGFLREDNLYKLRFKIAGSGLFEFLGVSKEFTLAPGQACLEIRWHDGYKPREVFAKWDQAPNPQEEDRLRRPKFKPYLVPFTYYLPLFVDREYEIPIMFKGKNDRYEVFSGWWFGKNTGYGGDYTVKPDTEVTLSLIASNAFWTRSFKLKEIIEGDYQIRV
jgi:hypothetical protein